MNKLRFLSKNVHHRNLGFSTKITDFEVLQLVYMLTFIQINVVNLF